MQTPDLVSSSRAIDRQQQIDRARIDIEIGWKTGLLMGCLNIIVLISLLFDRVSVERINWLGIAAISIEIPIICGCVWGIYRHNILAARVLFGLFWISALVGTVWAQIFPSAVLFLYPPFTPFLIYGLFKGINGTSNLKFLTDDPQSLETIDCQDNSDEIDEIKLRKQIDRARRGIAGATISGLLLLGLTFLLTTTCSRLDLHEAQIDVSPLIILVDALVISICTFFIAKNSTTALVLIMVYSVLCLLMKIPPNSENIMPNTEKFHRLFNLTLILTPCLFYSFIVGLLATIDLRTLTQAQNNFYLALKHDSKNTDINTSDT